jgi:hypothetical protein
MSSSFCLLLVTVCFNPWRDDSDIILVWIRDTRHQINDRHIKVSDAIPIGTYVASFYPMWSGRTEFSVRLYLPAHAAEVLAREVDTREPGPVYLVIMLRLPWGQVWGPERAAVMTTRVRRQIISDTGPAYLGSCAACRGMGHGIIEFSATV